jgi:hypothetical protein
MCITLVQEPVVRTSTPFFPRWITTPGPALKAVMVVEPDRTATTVAQTLKLLVPLVPGCTDGPVVMVAAWPTEPPVFVG